MKPANIMPLVQFLYNANSMRVEIDGKWYPARPIGWDTWPMRFKCAWYAFTGIGDAVIWPKGQ